MYELWERFMNLQLFAADDGGGDGGPDTGGDDGGNKGDGDQTAGDGDKGDVKTMSQAEIDAMIERRLARARKQWETEQEEARKKEQMTETERLQAEKEAAERKAQEAQQAANQRLIAAEAKVQAVTLGIKPERVAYALKLADLSGVEVGDNGEPDSAAIKAALESVLKDLPELKGAPQGPGKSGGEFKGGGSAGADDSALRRAMGLT